MASTCIADGISQVHKKTDVTKYESLDVFKEPRCLIAPDTEGKLQIRDDVLCEIKQIQLPLSVITIAGPFRTGKSYLLNRLAGVKKGFKLGSTIKAQTKGIWVWCRPHPTKDNQILLLMDTEGLGDVEKGDRNDDNHIFALAILLSNTMIYNISGTFTAENVDKLAFVTEVSKLLKVPEGKHGMDMRSLALFSPLFILTLRDFTLELKLDGREITSDEYLEDFCLSEQPENNERACMMNQTRLCLKHYFNKKKCFIFAPPGGPKILQKIEEFQDESLDKDFVAESKKFIDFVFKKTPQKEIENGQPINGERFAVLVDVYVEAIRTGKIPDVGDALQTVAEQENKKALEKCVEIYVTKMTNSLTFPIPEKKSLSEANFKYGWEAIHFFRLNSICNTNNSYLRQAHERIMSEYENFIRRDEEESMQKSQKELKALHAVILQNIERDRYSSNGGYKSYKEDIENLKASYDKLPGLGCKKNEALVMFINQQWTEAETILTAEVKMKMEEKRKREESHLVKKHEESIQEKDRLVKKQLESIWEKDRLVKKQEKRLQEQDRLVEEQEKRIQKQDRLVEEQEKILRKQDEELAQLKEANNRSMWNRVSGIWPMNFRRS